MERVRGSRPAQHHLRYPQGGATPLAARVPLRQQPRLPGGSSPSSRPSPERLDPHIASSAAAAGRGEAHHSSEMESGAATRVQRARSSRSSAPNSAGPAPFAIEPSPASRGFT